MIEFKLSTLKEKQYTNALPLSWHNTPIKKHQKVKEIDIKVFKYLKEKNIKLSRNEHRNHGIYQGINIPFFHYNTRTIFIKPASFFNEIEEYYFVLFHEIGHATRLTLPRDLNYYNEELVADTFAIRMMEHFGQMTEYLYKNRIDIFKYFIHCGADINLVEIHAKNAIEHFNNFSLDSNK